VKISKRQLRKIIKEEVIRVDESVGLLPGLGFGSHGTGMNSYNATFSRNSSPAALALNRKLRQNKDVVSERFNPAIKQKLLRDVTDFVDQYMLGMGMNPSDPADIRRVRNEIDRVVGTLLGGDY